VLAGERPAAYDAAGLVASDAVVMRANVLSTSWRAPPDRRVRGLARRRLFEDALGVLPEAELLVAVLELDPSPRANTER
jgi:hypothetical protein